MSEPVPLRIVVVAPPSGVPWALQVGRDELIPPAGRSPDALAFELAVTLAPNAPDAAPVFRGPAAQGPPAGRFVYLCAGRRAGDPGSPWERRAKVPLGGITAEHLARLRETPGGVLEARIQGTARDGGPACATVPLLAGGWAVVAGDAE